MAYNFNVNLNTKNFEIAIDTDKRYGYFEHTELGDGCGGGLWFELVDDKLSLFDYDGVYALPKEVRDALRTLYTVDESFD